MKLNENIAYARSILNRMGINPSSPDYQYYNKIREICGNNNGYVGILTKLYFIDGVTDMEEIQSIFDILKNSKIDINKLNSLTYEELLDKFYNEFSQRNNKDYELIFNDSHYNYYKVYTYEGILKIGSPAWCTKTKSNWDSYINKYPDQWVVIDRKYLNRLVSPNSEYFGKYENKKYPQVRFGISINNDGTFIGHDDNNDPIVYNPQIFPIYGILATMINLKRGIKKSYYDNFNGCEFINGDDKINWHKVINREKFRKSITLISNFIEREEIYVGLTKNYKLFPIILLLDSSQLPLFYIPITTNNNSIVDIPSSDILTNIFEDFARRKMGIFYITINKKNGIIDEDEIISVKYFFKKIKNFLVFDLGTEYLFLNCNIENGYQLPLVTLNGFNCNMNNPLCFYIIKSNNKAVGLNNKELTNSLIDLLDK